MPKYWGETNVQPWEFPRSGSKAKDGEKERKMRERLNDGYNYGQLHIANSTSGGARKSAWAKMRMETGNEMRMNMKMEMKKYLTNYLI